MEICPDSKKVRVVGAGFSGLVTAFYLQRLGYAVEIFEKKPHCGGLIRTHTTPLGLVETAANAFLWNEDLQDLCDAIEVKLIRSQPESRKRYIFREEKPRRWPLTIGETFIFISRWTWSFLLRKLRPQVGETIEAWGQRNLGAAGLNYLLSPALTGIYAGDPRRLSSSLILGRFFKPQKRKGNFRGSVAPEKGMGELISRLISYLKDKGVTFHQGQRFYESPLSSEPVFFCGSLMQMAETFNISISSLEMLPLITVTQFYKKGRELKGFGVLFPASEGFKVLGVLFNSNIFTGRSHLESETWILGGALQPSLIDKTESEILEMIAESRRRLLSESEMPEKSFVTYWPEALPHYTVDLERWLKEVKLPSNVFLLGNFTGFLGLGQILKNIKITCEEWDQKQRLL